MYEQEEEIEENKMESTSVSQFSPITNNNTSENDNKDLEESKEQQVIFSDFLREHDLLPTPHGGALKWKEAYFEIALSLWKPLNAQRSTKPASVDEFIFNYKTSEKLYRDKGKGKFTSKMN